MAWATHCQCQDFLQEEERREPEGRVLHEATLHDFLKRTGVLVHATVTIEGGWRGFHAAGRQTADQIKQIKREKKRLSQI